MLDQKIRDYIQDMGYRGIQSFDSYWESKKSLFVSEDREDLQKEYDKGVVDAEKDAEIEKQTQLEKEGYSASFALREQVGGRGEPYLTYEILRPWERWHDKVRGDGGSYRSGGPKDVFSFPNESLANFQQRVSQIAKEWEEESNIEWWPDDDSYGNIFQKETVCPECGNISKKGSIKHFGDLCYICS
jgi:hypothetical protein